MLEWRPPALANTPLSHAHTASPRPLARTHDTNTKRNRNRFPDWGSPASINSPQSPIYTSGTRAQAHTLLFGKPVPGAHNMPNICCSVCVNVYSIVGCLRVPLRMCPHFVVFQRNLHCHKSFLELGLSDVRFLRGGCGCRFCCRCRCCCLCRCCCRSLFRCRGRCSCPCPCRFFVSVVVIVAVGVVDPVVVVVGVGFVIRVGVVVAVVAVARARELMPKTDKR